MKITAFAFLQETDHLGMRFSERYANTFLCQYYVFSTINCETVILVIVIFTDSRGSRFILLNDERYAISVALNYDAMNYYAKIKHL